MVDNRSEEQKKADQQEVRKQQAANDQQLRERSAATGADPTGVREDRKDDPRPPRPAPGAPVTHPNVPGEGYRPNPANGAQDLPPERQAPRPEDPAHIGMGRQPQAAPVEQPRQAGFDKPGEQRPQQALGSTQSGGSQSEK